MIHDLNHAATLLAKGQLQCIDDGMGLRVQVLSGRLWLTQQGEARDIVLDAGEEAAIGHNGLSILSALRDSRYVLLDRQPQPDARRPRCDPRALSTALRRALWLS